MKAAFNQVNVGTCERNQATYLEQHISAPGRRGSGPAVDWHLSGHSHRSRVYKVRWQQDNVRATATRRIQVISASHTQAKQANVQRLRSDQAKLEGSNIKLPR